ncbi:MAG TPA: TDT family transporter [Solirubrobacteraceae bacterium]|nr:TDT family transporter [Solirubrobacteraceae bacterium]
MNTFARPLNETQRGLSATARLGSGRRARFSPRPHDLIRGIGPNWFASVMGTGIVANAAALLPVSIPALKSAALGLWLLAAAMLLVLGIATAAQWIRHQEIARGHHMSPTMAPFYGAPPMAILTVGAGAILVGKQLIGTQAAVVTDSALWTVGTVAGLLASVAIPYLMFTGHRLEQSMTLGSWLMPIVPPMVSAATGAALIPHLASGQLQLTLLFACYAMFGLSLLASLVVICLVWARLAYHGPGPAETVPTFWIVLGPLGQSVTAAHLLGVQASAVLHGPVASAFSTMGVLYGVPVWGFAMLWLALAAAITISTARAHLPFSLTWWSFTFPVGTVVTGTSGLAIGTGADLFTVAAVSLYILLVVAWGTAFVHTVRGTISGRLLGVGTPLLAQVVAAR